MSAFTPEQLAYLQAHRNDSRVAEIHWVYSVPIALATISTILRIWAKTAGRNGITLDDWLIIAATVCSPSKAFPGDYLTVLDRCVLLENAQAAWDSAHLMVWEDMLLQLSLTI